MKKAVASSLLLFVTFFFCSCEKNEENQTTQEAQETIEYYVEYQAKYTVGHGNYTTLHTTISYKTPNGVNSTTIDRGQDFSVTVGPFKKGDKTYISGNAPTNGMTHSARSAILVKKGDAPFVQKAESTTSLSCSYTINF